MLEYNQKEYIDQKLQKNNMIVNGDIVLVDGWSFKIDRSVPKIGVSLGKGILEEQIQITVDSQTSEDYAKATITAQITYGSEITEILCNGESIKIPEKQEGKYTITKEVTTNENYYIIAKSKEKYNLASITIENLTQDMEIWTKDDLVAFKNNVNSGRTYQGKTVKVMADIDLSSICGAGKGSFDPIGNNNVIFKGNFDGGYKTISNLYMESNQYNFLGLFYYNQGTIQNLILENVYINNTAVSNATGTYTAGIVAKHEKGDIINCGINSGNIKSCTKTPTSGTWRANGVGGIVGSLKGGNINSCYNKANITSENYLIDNTGSYVGGIFGISVLNTNPCNIIDCYNTGNLSANGFHSYIGGIGGQITKPKEPSKMANCYNCGTLSETHGTDYVRVGGIIGENGWSDENYPLEDITNCYSTNVVDNLMIKYDGNSKKQINITEGIIDANTLKNTDLGTSYTADTKKENGTFYNEGYPILKWQVKP